MQPIKKLVLAVGLLAVVQSVSGYGITIDYNKKLHHYLTEKLKPRSLATYIEAHLEKGCELLVTQSKSLIFKGFAEFLRTFCALSSIDLNNCEPEGFELIMQNDANMGGRCFNSSIVEQDLYRQELTVRRLGQKHAYNCQEYFNTTFNERVESQDDEQKHLFARAPLENQLALYFSIDDAICRMRHMSTKELNKKVFNIFFHLPDNFDPKLDSDLSFSRHRLDKSSSKRIMNNDKVAVLANRYIIEPCKYLISTFGDIMPAAYRSTSMMTSHVAYHFKIEQQPIFKKMPSFCLCNLLMKHDESSILKAAQEAVRLIKHKTDMN